MFNLDFGHALDYLKCGRKIQRKGWNGKGMWLALRTVDKQGEVGDMTLPFIYMKTVQNDLVPWLASQTDVLAEDWEVVEE